MTSGRNQHETESPVSSHGSTWGPPDQTILSRLPGSQLVYCCPHNISGQTKPFFLFPLSPLLPGGFWWFLVSVANSSCDPKLTVVGADLGSGWTGQTSRGLCPASQYQPGQSPDHNSSASQPATASHTKVATRETSHPFFYY